jgi:7-carboxy-7-deazaguanine synthase (Cx14CxxC type)
MAYTVKEIFYTLQGEGANAGRPAVFCRFSGCNLWSGLESDRPKAICQFCDTDFVGGRRYQTAEALAAEIEAHWPTPEQRDRFVVVTGGEPALQFDEALKAALHRRGFFIAMESNGTVALSAKPDWLTVSPKSGTHLQLTSGDELKVVMPQAGLDLPALKTLAFRLFYVQPKDEAGRTDENTRAALAFCKANPSWRLSIQTHKTVGFP